MTAGNAFYAQNTAFYRAVFSNGFKRIGRATGVEPTSITNKWADEELIEFYGCDDGDEGKPAKQ